MFHKRPFVVASAGVALILGLAACGNGSSLDGAAAVQGSGSLDGAGKTLVVFMPSTSNSYLGAASAAVEAEAGELNFKVKIVENNFDQNEQDQQVQQWIATGEEAAAILYWPASAEAGVNSSRLLSAKAPVIQFNQSVPESGKEFVAAYAGVSDLGIGSTAGKMALQSAEEERASGTKFDGPEGKPNLLEISFPTGYQAGSDRSSSFADVAGDTFNRLASEPAPTVDAQGGFEAASQIIPKFKGEGINYIYAHSNNVAVGVIKALEQNGLKPGKDVIVIAGDYSGDKKPLRDGKIYSSVVQSPVIEGELAVDTAAKYLAAGKTQPGETTVAPDAVKPEVTTEAPFEATFIPSPPILPSEYSSFKIWGLGIDELVF